jgi:hypothetical protein
MLRFKVLLFFSLFSSLVCEDDHLQDIYFCDSATNSTNRILLVAMQDVYVYDRYFDKIPYG